MKKVIFAYVLISALLLAGCATNAGNTNFAGTWALNMSGENMPRQLENVKSYTMVVSQDNKELTVENKIERNETAENPDGGTNTAQDGRGGGGRRGGFGMPKATYSLDGKETSTESQRGTSKLKANWQGSALELTAVRNNNAQGNETTNTTVERWELADGGKTLQVHRKVDSPRGTTEYNLTFTKQ
jgi:hypothetical protein